MLVDAPASTCEVLGPVDTVRPLPELGVDPEPVLAPAETCPVPWPLPLVLTPPPALTEPPWPPPAVTVVPVLTDTPVLPLLVTLVPVDSDTPLAEPVLADAFPPTATAGPPLPPDASPLVVETPAWTLVVAEPPLPPVAVAFPPVAEASTLVDTEGPDEERVVAVAFPAIAVADPPLPPEALPLVDTFTLACVPEVVLPVEAFPPLPPVAVAFPPVAEALAVADTIGVEAVEDECVLAAAFPAIAVADPPLPPEALPLVDTFTLAAGSDGAGEAGTAGAGAAAGVVGAPADVEPTETDTPTPGPDALVDAEPAPGSPAANAEPGNARPTIARAQLKLVLRATDPGFASITGKKLTKRLYSSKGTIETPNSSKTTLADRSSPAPSGSDEASKKLPVRHWPISTLSEVVDFSAPSRTC